MHCSLFVNPVRNTKAYCWNETHRRRLETQAQTALSSKRKSKYLNYLRMSMNPNMSKKFDAFDLFIMSVWKPDPELRTEALEQGCYNELMEIREDMLEYLQAKSLMSTSDFDAWVVADWVKLFIDDKIWLTGQIWWWLWHWTAFEEVLTLSGGQWLWNSQYLLCDEDYISWSWPTTLSNSLTFNWR